MSCSNADIIALIGYFDNGDDLSARQWENYNFYDLWNAAENNVTPPVRSADSCGNLLIQSVYSVSKAIVGDFTTSSQFLGFNLDFYFLYLKAIGSPDPSPTFQSNCVAQLYDVFEVNNFDSDYQDVIDYANVQGYTLPSSGQQNLQNQLVLDLKAEGIWSKLGTFGVWATDGDSDFALINWKTLTQMAAVNSPLFSLNTGFTGDGTSSYINLNESPESDSQYQVSNASLGAWYSNVLTRTDGIGLGTRESGNNKSNGISPFDSTRWIGTVNDDLGFAVDDYTRANGYFMATRSNSSSFDFYLNGSLVVNTARTEDLTLTTENFYALAINSGSSTPVAFSDDTIAIVHLGADLSAEASAMNTAITNYLNAI